MDTSEEADVKLGGAVKQTDEKHASSELREMVWSPKMDLVAAVALPEPNDVILYRFHSLAKLWTHPSPSDTSIVRCLAWGPLGKCLAVAYSTGQVMILSVEKAGVLYTHNINSIPTKLYWHAVDQPEKRLGVPLFKDLCDKMLPEVPTTSRENESRPSVTHINRDILNYLVVSDEDGIVNIYVYGLLSIAHINLHNYSAQHCRALSSCLSRSSSSLVSIGEDDTNVYLTVVNTDVLAARNEEIQVLADKFVKLLSLLEQCDLSVNKMVEAWEDSLMELDSKLNQFAQQKQELKEGTVLNDFLELLLFGTPSDLLKVFLVKDLTERGMKKLGTSLQTYYRTMEELLTINMQGAVESIFYHLNDLYGLSQWSDTFALVGLDTAHVNSALQACGSLCLKINEMQQLITTGTKNLRAFSSWLYRVILRISEQEISERMNSFIPDPNAVAEFLEDNFKGLEESNSRIRLEKVGQYLRDDDLVSPLKLTENNLWDNLTSIPHLAASGLIYKAEPNKSLIQLYKRLALGLRDALTTPAVSVIRTMSIGTQKLLCKRTKFQALQQFSFEREDSSSLIYTAYLSERPGSSDLKLVVTRLVLAEHSLPLYQCELEFGRLGQGTAQYTCQIHKVLDFDHYLKEEIIVLLQQRDEDQQAYLTVRLNLANIPSDYWVCDSAPTVVDAAPWICPSYIKILQNATNALCTSSSGKRDIGSVMLSSRRVRLFMYDVDDDSDDESLTASASMLEESTIGSDKENSQS
ncbi:anaphase-promoting complex subunit 4-like [Watersipora subatra]|uniref:anaphase-promoting complex subunit 4-like n=1 Tax=Watersipora subatra TaxID=2589382 RepID=UPI00355C99B4